MFVEHNSTIIDHYARENKQNSPLQNVEFPLFGQKAAFYAALGAAKDFTTPSSRPHIFLSH